MKNKIIALITIFAIVTAMSCGICFTSNQIKNDNKSDAELNIVTSFYPIYIIALNVCDGIDNINVTNLTPNQTGCLHEYQFTTSDMKTLEDCDAFVINGGGMEPFVDDVTDTYPDMNVIDSGKGAYYLEGETHEHGDEEHESNAHIWLNTSNYKLQINNVCEGLSDIYPEYSDTFKNNASNYIKKVDSIEKELKDINVKNSAGVIIFHDAFAYLADEIGLTVAAQVDIDNENSALSSGEIANIINEVKEHDIKYIFIEKQFKTTIADSICAETDAKAYVIDSLVAGENSKDAYIDGMRNNIEILNEISR